MLIQVASFSRSCVMLWTAVSMSCDHSSMRRTQWYLLHGSMVLIMSSRTDCRTSPELSASSHRCLWPSWGIITPGMERKWWASKLLKILIHNKKCIILILSDNMYYCSSWPVKWSDCICLVFKFLDVYAAMACVEHLEPRVLDRHTQRQAWLRQVKNLQVPIEMICSEDSVRRYRERSRAIVSRVQ